MVFNTFARRGSLIESPPEGIARTTYNLSSCVQDSSLSTPDPVRRWAESGTPSGGPAEAKLISHSAANDDLRKFQIQFRCGCIVLCSQIMCLPFLWISCGIQRILFCLSAESSFELVAQSATVRMLPGIQPPCDQIAGGFVQLANSFAFEG